jgi:hypothetical protein
MKTLSLLFSASLLFLFSCDTGENTENTDSTKPPSRILAKPGLSRNSKKVKN